jgi:predicted transcriptional regulator
MKNRRNYYRILQVQPDAPVEIIRASYRTMMRELKRIRYSMPALRASVMWAFRSLEEAAVDSPGRSGRGNGNQLDERRRRA